MENNYKLDKIDSFGLYIKNQNITYIRRTILVCICLYSFFAILDYLIYPELVKHFYIIRFGVVVPYLVFLYIFSYSRFFKRMQQFLLILLYFLAGGGIVVMTYLIGGDNYYTNGLFLVFAIGFHLIRLRLKNSIFAFFLVIVFFVLLEILTNAMTIEQVLVNAFFYISFASIGIFGGFFNDKYLEAQLNYEKKVCEERTIYEVKINQQLEEINNAHVETIYAIAKLAESRDELTSDHLNRVGELSYILADSLGEDIYKKNNIIKQELLESIRLASVLHDIGKVSIPMAILNKPGKLTKDEFEIIKTHTTIGAETLTSISKEAMKNDFVIRGIEIAKYHHEKWDGSGYPDGLEKYKIPFSARIVAVIDVFDALISKRPYKEKFTKEKSLNIINEGLGKHFDPEIGRGFITLAKESDDKSLFGS